MGNAHGHDTAMKSPTLGVRDILEKGEKGENGALDVRRGGFQVVEEDRNTRGRTILGADTETRGTGAVELTGTW